VIGGYLSSSDALDSILVGYDESRDLIYAGSINAGISLEYRARPAASPGGSKPRCPFANLPDRSEGVLAPMQN
jgi:hypothetical protein